MNRRLLKAVLQTTLPVMLGYLSIGMAFGVLLEHIGYNYLWAGFMSLVIYAGSMEYIAVDILRDGVGLLNVAVMSLLVQARHMVYGLSLIEKFKGMGKYKPYMIFALTDETYALLATAKAPEGADPKLFYFLVSLFNHLYWITGSVVGAVAGALLQFNTKGIEFAMTALFIVICTEQWLSYPAHFPAVIGAVCTTASLLLFGRDNMLIPAILMIILILFVARNRLSVKLDLKKPEGTVDSQ